MDAVAAEVIDMHPGLPGAVGPAAGGGPVCRRVVALDRSRGPDRRAAARPRCGGGAAVPRAPGHMRKARPDDVPTVVAWLRAFADEALGEAPHVEDVELTYRRREADPDGAWLVWDDGGPVSLAGYGNPTPSGIRVGPVYTPPEHRGRGYATSLVADLTAERLASRPRVLLPLHRPREPDLERDLRPDRLRAGRRLGSVVVPAA